MNKSEYFETSEMALASALLCLGHKLDFIEKRDPKSIFTFQRDEFLDKTIQGFWAGELRVEPKSYFTCIREVKSRLYADN